MLTRARATVFLNGNDVVACDDFPGWDSARFNVFFSILFWILVRILPELLMYGLTQRRHPMPSSVLDQTRENALGKAIETPYSPVTGGEMTDQLASPAAGGNSQQYQIWLPRLLLGTAKLSEGRAIYVVRPSSTPILHHSCTLSFYITCTFIFSFQFNPCRILITLELISWIYQI